MASPTHTSRIYEQELRNLREKLLLMGSLVEEMIANGTRALAARDTALAQTTMRIDRRINRLECEVDELAMRILATRQPVASDLRFLTTALKIVTDLERIGDLCVNICERVIELNEEAPLPSLHGKEIGAESAESRSSLSDLESLAQEASAVVHEALDALVNRDVDHARQLLTRDDSIDAHYSRIFDAVLSLMASDPKSVYRATRVQSIAKYLERIADHAMNVAETVVFLVKGTDIRHRNRMNDSEPPPPVAPGKLPG
ncbi:MAG: phosphate signaling complex protein PhoU [Byssovorax sp.]